MNSDIAGLSAVRPDAKNLTTQNSIKKKGDCNELWGGPRSLMAIALCGAGGRFNHLADSIDH